MIYFDLSMIFYYNFIITFSGGTTMKIGEIVGYGVFDSSVKFPNLKKTKERQTSSFEFEYILSSSATSIINDRQYPLRANTFLLRKPKQICSSILHFKCYFFHLSMRENCEYYDMLLHAPEFLQIIDSEKYKSIMEELILHMQTENDTESDFITAKLLELFYFIRRDSPKNANYIRLYPGGDERFISGSLRFMQERFGEKITLEILADHAGYSPNYFHRIFTEIMGITPQQYLLQIRINNAKRCLANTKKSLSEIAYECGFSSQSHLTVQFKKAVLLTPYEYRKSNLSKYFDED